MADLYELIERVQVTLASSRSPGKEELREIHGELSDQIRGANRRLRECDALLAKGHRTEAIQLAEQEPPLLDVVAILDFPELPEWNDFVAELGLTVAPELQIEIAADLNRAYSEDAPLEQQLRLFRRCSLARAPLRVRIALLKKIASLDAGNPVWESDRRSYEEVRLRQIRDEFQTASQNADLEKLRDIATELRGDWLLPPGKQLIGRVSQAVKAVQGEGALRRLAKTTRDLRDAWLEQDLELALKRAAEWESTAGACPDTDEFHNLRKQAREALTWARDQQGRQSQRDDFQQALRRLQRAIDGVFDLGELERRYNAVTRFADHPIPNDVQDDYERAVQNIQRRRKVRFIIVSSSIAAGVLIVGLVLLIWKLGS